ncbi:MAG: thiamine pyrophosphate-binding protein [Gammaproteobacteria bacterium]|nr:thiamine pyrophosphate-binding protein [Gammaproteobacteria bacterium]MDH5302901.1 thiamine pyrophosphate-binding protein [Gammaproteobacteria bacterium]MDH5321006.1 thiamine pyrophosphate-binding protein [Gammaproteobacteria bacterium]
MSAQIDEELAGQKKGPDDATAARVTGAMYMAECLRQEGVSKVFGQCGHTNYALIDACHRLGIEFVSFRHEQMAAHAADAYFRVTHKLAVLNVHLSPGLTNTLTGVATAAADSTPMVVFAGNTPSYHHAREPHQGIRFHADASQGDMFRPICKRVWRVDDAKLLVDVMPRALNVAQTGRPGAVLLDIPMDVFSAHIDPPNQQTRSRRPGYGRSPGDAEGIQRAAGLLRSAKSPAIFAGNGVMLSEAWEELRAVAEQLNAPVATTLMAKGVFPEDHALSCGSAGIWGTRMANEALLGADVILAVGTAFGEADCSSWIPGHTFSIPPSRLIQLDISPEEIGKIYPVEVGIVGDAKATLAAIAASLHETSAPNSRSNERLTSLQRQRDAWNKELATTQADAGMPIHPARLLAEISRAAPEDTVFVTDVGWNKNGAGQQLVARHPQTFITSGGMATMGFAPAAAIGAKIGLPDRKVAALVGDGGFLSVAGAMTTAVELGIPVLWIIFNNFCFSTIRTVGTTYFNNAYGTEFTTPDGKPYNPDFLLLAESFGLKAARVEQPADLAKALAKAFAADEPYLLEVRTRGDVPMPRTGYWDIADFLAHGND